MRSVPPCWTQAQKCCLLASGGPTSGGKLLEGIEGHGQKKTRPRKAQGGRWRYSRFFRRLPDYHDREQQNKQYNQAGVTSSRIMYLIGLLYRSRIPCASARRLQAAASSKVLYNALYGCHLWPRPPIPAYTRYFTAVSSILRRAGQAQLKISCGNILSICAESSAA